MAFFRLEKQKVLISLLSIAAYFLLAIPAHWILGDATADLSIIPVVIISWELGAPAGLGFGLLVTLFILIGHWSKGILLLDQTHFQMMAAGVLTYIISSFATVYVRKLQRRAKTALAERLKAEENLRVSEQKYRLLFEHMAEGIVILDLVYDDLGRLADWIIQDVNPAFLMCRAASREGVIGQSGRARMETGRPDTEYVRQQYETSARTGAPVQFEYALPDEQKDLLLTATPMNQNRLAVIFSDITEHKRAMQAEQEQRRLAEALRDTAAALSSTLELEVVLDRILHYVREIACYDAVNVMLIHQGEVSVVRYQGYAERDLETYINGFRQPVNMVPGFRWIAEHKRPMIIPDTHQDGLWEVFPPTAWIRSYAGLPIQVRGELIGFLNFNSATPGLFDDSYVDRLMPFADQAGLAIANARAYEDTQRKAHRLAMVNRVAIALNQPLERNAVLQMTVDCLAEALNLSQSALALYTPQRDRLVIAADHPMPGAPSMVGKDIPLENNQSMEIILREKTALLIGDAQQDGRLATMREAMKERGILSMLLVPLVVRNEVIGTIGCDATEPGRRFSSEDIELAETITNLAAVRIEQARLFAEERKRASELALLHVTSLELTTHNNLPTLLQTIVERAAWLIDAPGGTLFLADPQKELLECRVTSFFSPEQIGTILHYGEGAAGTAAATGMPLVVADYQAWPHKVLTRQQTGDFLAVASVPVIWQNKITGVIQLGRIDPLRPFTQEEVDLLCLFSSQVAISLENARRFHEVQLDAIQDTLTGVYNRRGLFDAGQREIDRSRRGNQPLSALMIDIDHFKLVNDTYGHQAGDQVLARLAEICRQKVRGTDIVGRYGGEEFVLLVENDIHGAQMVAQRICRFIAHAPFHTESGDVRVTVSIGAAQLDGSIDGLQGLIHTADEALYHAKRKGRNRVEAG